MNSFSDEHDLLLRARNFDLSVLEYIYDRYQIEIFNYAYRQTGDRQVAEECTAETFSRFLTALREGKGPKNYLRAYLYRIAHNWITDHYYKTLRENAVPLQDECEIEGEEPPEEQSVRALQNETVRNALKQLTPDQRLVVSLRFIEDWPIEEVARVLQKPSGAVKSTQHRALEKLKKLLFEERSG